MRGAQVKQVTATGDVTTASVYLRSVSLTGNSDAASATIKFGGSSGTTVAVLRAAANTVAEIQFHDALAASGIHVTITGTSPSATFVYAP